MTAPRGPGPAANARVKRPRGPARALAPGQATATAPALTPAPWKGLALGVLAMALFGLTLPMTQLATGTAAVPQLSPALVTFGRAVLAAGLSLLALAVLRGPWPQRRHWPWLLLAAAGNALAYPLLLALALRQHSSQHAAVVTALAPLFTALCAALLLRQRAGRGFWAWAVLGCLLVCGHSLWRQAQAGGGPALGWADLGLAAGVLAASLGYVAGAQVTPALGAERVICWVLLAALPATLAGTVWSWPGATWSEGWARLQQVQAAAWWGLAYVSVFSMWGAFFAWYRALAWGDALRLSQVQLLQPFFAMLFAWPLHGQRPALASVLVGVAVVGTVAMGRASGARTPLKPPLTGPEGRPGPPAPGANPPWPAGWRR